MTIAETVAGSLVSRAMLPWLLFGATVALSMSGAAGMYAGYEIANARYAAEVMELNKSHIALLEARTKQYLEANERGTKIADDFFGALKNMKVVNTTINNEVRHETEKQIYIDCKVPESGTEVLQRRINDVNRRISGGKP